MVDKSSLKELCFKIPKAELHVHLEDTIEPEMKEGLRVRQKEIIWRREKEKCKRKEKEIILK